MGILGDFLCYFIPMGQVLGTTASSFALLAIALDRYQNVTVAIISKRWNPNLWKCLLAAFLSWIVSSGWSWKLFKYKGFFHYKMSKF
ncbi:hypothetical protein NQ314_006210 [Rhamnusium bicolor]|uniref:G-protein coupled receptors family 1 profile domain-containing protein n=1 Tax=Rhamnusium bicolor TaxID=1586634 RepID=A0AAV8Z8C0_9CUCU|nr:hypothetical protein NQ314_006210 [Rhamnusium bicolor]